MLLEKTFSITEYIATHSPDHNINVRLFFFQQKQVIFSLGCLKDFVVSSEGHQTFFFATFPAWKRINGNQRCH